MTAFIGRREFITLLGGAAAAWPLAARAQQPERMRRIGVLLNRIADDPEGQARLTAFVQGLQQLGWVDGRNVRMDVRWAAGVADHFRKYAAELVALVPDVILTDNAVGVAALQHATRTVPIVFVTVTDPVGGGFVKSLARPGGNSTGFASFEYSVAGKWLELIKEIAPRVTRAAVLRDPTIAENFTKWFRKQCERAGLRGLTPHGLRKAACRRLADAQCTVHQIAAISGHASLREVARYTAAADQERLARSAMERLDRTEGQHGLSNPTAETV
jgi:ABC-type uncharacterized transport system substrate-binding protein